MSDKQFILKSIATIAKRLRRTPSLLEFVARAGISKHSVFRFFSKWNDAVRAAGLRPRKPRVKLGDSELLKDWGSATRKKQGLLSRRSYPLAGKYDPSTLAKRFGGWTSVPRAFRKFARGKREWKDVLAILNSPASKKVVERTKSSAGATVPTGQAQHAPRKDRATYGNPIDFRGFRHEPVNEQGVVLLFGMVAKELGYLVESVQKGFPDCEAKRRIGPDRWQRVNIEFEFESKNFRQHGHSATGCDVIVCWRHNWDACPENIEVVELSSIIKSL
jgi:hypothetical protein